MFETHSIPKSGRPRSTVTVMAALLAGCMLLAASLRVARHLGPALVIPGWSISFQPPSDWQPQPIVSRGPVESIRFVEPTSNKPGRKLIATRISGVQSGAGKLCRDEASRLLGNSDPIWWLALRQFLEPNRLGPLKGISLVLPEGAYIKAGVLDSEGRDREGYVLTLVTPQRISSDDFGLAEAITKSVQVIRE